MTSKKSNPVEEKYSAAPSLFDSVKNQDQTPKSITPMMAQYFSIKEFFPDSLLFYRMGDFYELFFEDANIASNALNIALTTRGSHLGQDIPMCGVPAVSYETYLSKLIEKGFRVAVCEQMESPQEAKKRGRKSVVKRAVTRLMTPGTLTEEHLLDAKSHNFLAALVEDAKGKALSWLDITTGDFYVQSLINDELPTLLAEINCKELLLPEKLLNTPEFFECFALWKKILRPLPSSRFNFENSKNILQSFFAVETLESFGDFTSAHIRAAGALLDYIKITQISSVPHLLAPKIRQRHETMQIDPATRHHLELTRTQNGKREGSLIHQIDYCLTSAGSRLLSDRISHPLTNPASIDYRLDAIEFFIENMKTSEKIREILKNFPDIERALSRLHIQRGIPRDLAVIRDGISYSSRLKALIAPILPSATRQIRDVFHGLGMHDPLCAKLEQALSEHLPLHIREGGFIASGYHPRLDALKKTNHEKNHILLSLETKYRKICNIDNLKIKYNAILGFFIEISSRHNKKISAISDLLTLRQSTAYTMRYSTEELELNARHVTETKEKIYVLEYEIFEKLCDDVLEKCQALTLCAKAIAQLDLSVSFSVLAKEKNYCRPKTNDSTAFLIKQGRHPTAEGDINFKGGFIANDCDLGSDKHLWLITGPNMAGKSTFLRQNALIAILAQSGCYVPAESCQIGIVDRLFSRIGASDDLALGQSTFMVEMVETATILNQSTEKSFVILDEIGRGTATFDGLSIAWATTEYLHNKIKCRTLFATHYHELTSLQKNHPALYPVHFRIKEWENNIIFLYKIAEGSAGQSYGIHVAKIAGIPNSIINRAKILLKNMESNKNFFKSEIRQKDSLDSNKYSDLEKKYEKIITTLHNINPDQLSPREALDKLYQLKNIFPKKSD